jgi:hypothetical protein
MQEPNWVALKLPSDWKNVLDQLISAARAAIQQGSIADRKAIAELLQKFIDNSPASSSAQDIIAAQVITDINISIIGNAIEGLHGNQPVINHNLTLIEAASAQAEKGERALKLEGLVKAVTTADKAISAMVEAEKTLKDPDKKLIEKLEAALKAIEDLKSLKK